MVNIGGKNIGEEYLSWKISPLVCVCNTFYKVENSTVRIGVDTRMNWVLIDM